MSSSGSSRPPFQPSPSFKLTQPPNPRWQLGEGLALSISAEGTSNNPDEPAAANMRAAWKEDEGKGWTSMDLGNMDKPAVYKFLTSAVTPRPVAFVSTLSANGVPNLAPFSYFSLVAHDPPLISVSFSLSPRRPKDTRENIRDTREFVVNLISEPFVEAANACSVEAPDEVDEWVVSGLTPELACTLVKPPRVRESAVSFECELFHYLDISPPGSSEVTNTLVLGHIRVAHVRNAVLIGAGGEGANAGTNSSPIVDPAKLRAISRLGGVIFARIGESFEIPRPSWREIRGRVAELEEKRKGVGEEAGGERK